jgi:hypothetical protein
MDLVRSVFAAECARVPVRPPPGGTVASRAVHGLHAVPPAAARLHAPLARQSTAGRTTRRSHVRLCHRDCACALCDARWAGQGLRPALMDVRTHGRVRAEHSRADAATELRHDCTGPSVDV